MASEQQRFANQKQIEITKVDIGEGDYYLRVRKDALQRAAQTLDAGPFKLYVYLADNMDGFRLNLSPKAVENNFGMKLKQYRNAVDKLIETGYLYQPDPSKNNWVFLEGGKDSDEGARSTNAAIYLKGIEPKGIEPKGVEYIPKEEVSSIQNEQLIYPKDNKKDNKIIEIKIDNSRQTKEIIDNPYLDEMLARLSRN